MGLIQNIKRLPLVVKIIVGIAIILLLYVIYTKFRSTSTTPKYTTETATRGTLIQTISGSGTITSGNYTSIQTKVSGTVNAVYVTNGDVVTKGQKIADITLDDYAKERQAAAWVTYLQATEDVKTAEAAKITADIDMWNARQTLLDAQETYDNKIKDNLNPTTYEQYTVGEQTIVTKSLDEKKKLFSAAEIKYLNADATITNAYAKISSALRTYQENSATIVAPTSGIISDLALAPNIIVSASSTTSNTSGATIVSPITIGKISNPDGQLIATVTLSEVDVIKVKANQKVTLTLDAYADKTFTGKILAVNTSGSVNSGVTSYPVTILIDATTIDIYPNMAVNAKIITAVKDNVVLVPSSSITSTNGSSTVRILIKETVQQQPVEIGSSNDTQTEIISGINEGDVVVTSITSSTTTTGSSSSTRSVFGSFGGAGGVMRGAAGGR